MKIDFATPMTFYELLAIILAAIAIIIPVVQAIWKKWIIKARLSFHPTGRAMLFFNQSGSYIRIDGVYESERKSVSVKKITAKVTRQKDECKLNLVWSSFISPVNQSMVGNYLQTTESAHPFRIEADSITCAFTEFADPFDSFGKTFRASTEAIFNKISYLKRDYLEYTSAVPHYKNSAEYSIAKNVLSKEFFWEIGKYSIDIEVTYDNKIKHFYYTISVGEYEHEFLVENIDESLLSPLKKAYGVGWDYHTVFVELQS